MVVLRGVAHPGTGQPPGQDGTLYAEHLYPNDLLRYSNNTGLNHPALIDHGLAPLVFVQIECLPFTVHGVPAAGNHTAVLVLMALYNEVNLRTQPGGENASHTEHQLLKISAGGDFTGEQQHFLHRNRYPEALVVDHRHRQTRFCPLHTVQSASENAPGPMGVLDFMPDDGLPFLRRLHLVSGLNGQHPVSAGVSSGSGCFGGASFAGPAPGTRRRLGFLTSHIDFQFIRR